MKKLFLPVISILAILFNSCDNEKRYFSVNNYSRLEFNARTSLTQYVYPNTNMDIWEYELTYNTDTGWGESGETDWCTVERESTGIKITCEMNENKERPRSANISFRIDGKECGRVHITQAPYQYTEQERQIIDALGMLAEYNYLSLDVDFESKHHVDSADKYNGVFKYTGDGQNLSIPVELYAVRNSNYTSLTYQYQHHYVSFASTETASLSVTGSIYTADYWSYSPSTEEGSTIYREGDFFIRIYGDIDGKYYSKTLTNY